MLDNNRSTKKLSIEKHSDRIAYLDYLRVAATFAVMTLHMAAQKWYVMNVDSYEWNVFNVYDSIVRWCVPVFVMISGALFLNRNISIKKIYSKYVLRMVFSFLFWGFIYALFAEDLKFDQFIQTVLEGEGHMWFIPMIIGLYICIPLIQSIIQKQENMKYFIFLSFIFTFVIPQIVKMTNDFLPGVTQPYAFLLYKYVNNMNLNLVLGYTIYFILGYYFDSVDLTKRQRGIIYLLGVLGFIATIMLSVIVSIKGQYGEDFYYQYTTVNVLFESIAVYVWFKYNVRGNRYLKNIIIIFSKYSFGAYLIHILVIRQLDKILGLNTLSFNPVYSVPIIAVVVFVISFGCSAIFNNLPILKKYIV